MDKKYQVFISSTYTDLKEARMKVRDAILSMYHFPVGMELFGAANEEQWQIISETIDSSDYYVLIIGQRYGSIIPEGSPDARISYTEKEFRYALEKHVPILVFLLDDSIPVKPENMERDNLEKLFAFKNAVKNGRLVEWWKTPDDLAQKVTAALYKQITRTKRPGWIRGNSIDIEKSMSELVELSRQNRALEEENKQQALEIERLKRESERQPLLTVSLECTKPDEDEKYPEFFNRKEIVTIDEDGTVHLKLKSISTNVQEAEYYPLSRSDIPAEISRRITDDAIKTYNASLPSKTELGEYLKAYRRYLRVKKNGIPITFFVNNIGTAKATDVSVTIEFPNQMRVLNLDEAIDMDEPKAPEKGEDPIQKAYAQANYERAVALNLIPASIRGFKSLPDFSPLVASPFRNGNTVYSSIEIEENIVEIEQKQGIVHTKFDYFYGGYIVPFEIGEYEAKVTLMCAEYKNPEETTIKFIVEE